LDKFGGLEHTLHHGDRQPARKRQNQMELIKKKTSLKDTTGLLKLGSKNHRKQALLKTPTL
jgi:hypothetical protein